MGKGGTCDADRRSGNGFRAVWTPPPGGAGFGIALGSGGARGLAHVGVLQALLERGIRPAFVAGTSMGAIVGAAYAAGTFGKLAEILASMDAAKATALFLDVEFMKTGLVAGRRVMDFISGFVPDVGFEDLEIPFAALATDLRTGDPVCLSRGRVHSAIRASISIPGVFTPVRRDGALLVDGGISSPVPVSAARRLGATTVLAVNVDNGTDCLYESRRLPRPVSKAINAGERFRDALRREFGRETPGAGSLLSVLSQTIRICENRIAQWEVSRERPDWTLEPAVGNIPTMDFTRVDDAIRAGRDAVETLFSAPEAETAPGCDLLAST